jgi:hypothetical protein
MVHGLSLTDLPCDKKPAAPARCDPVRAGGRDRCGVRDRLTRAEAKYLPTMPKPYNLSGGRGLSHTPQPAVVRGYP